MSTLATVLPSIIGALFLAVGLLFMFNPTSEKVLARLQLTPGSIAGLANIRSFIGGTFVGLGVLLLHGVIAGDPQPFLMVAILLSAAVIGRVVGLVVDGRDKTVIAPLVGEIVLVGILLFSHNALSL